MNKLTTFAAPLQRMRITKWRLSKIRSRDAFFALSMLLTLLVGLMGLNALHQTPRLTFDDKLIQPDADTVIEEIHHVELDADYFRPFPWYDDIGLQQNWMRLQKVMATLLVKQTQVDVKLTEQGGFVEKTVQLVPTPFDDVVQKLGLLYVPAVAFLLFSMVVYFYYRIEAGLLLAYFFIAGALFWFTLAPFYGRELVLHYPHFAYLLKLNFLAMCAVSLLVIYLVKTPLTVYVSKLFIRAVEVAVYTFIVVTTLMFIYQFITLSMITYLLAAWALAALLLGAYLWFLEKDGFIKKQIVITLVMPLLMLLGVNLFTVEAPQLGEPLTRLVYLSFMSLLIPLLMVNSLSDLRIYHTRLFRASKAGSEADKSVKDFQVNLLQRFAEIANLSDSSLKNMDNSAQLKQNIKRVLDISVNFARHSHYFLLLTDAKSSQWQTLVQHLTRIGQEMCQGKKIQFGVKADIDPHAPQTRLPVRVCMYYTFTEAVANAIKHAGATEVMCEITAGRRYMTLGIRDNGKGFISDDQHSGHYGLKVLKRRLEEVGGLLQIQSETDKGTLVEARMPLS